MPKATLLIAIFLCSNLWAKNKIVGGTIPSEDHPGSYNTVALIKTADKKVFCTGSIISKRMILTAKHCLMDKKIKDFKVFFGADTNKLEDGILIGPSRMEVRHPVDWQMTFPSFDIAWVELSEDIPESFKALPILSERHELPKKPVVHLAGHGNSSPDNGKIEAGKKFFTTTGLRKYFDNSRFFHILSFKGPQGQGACHGDSGGPAYVKKDDQWYIVGVTNGFDVVLTPNAMSRTNDEDFPYNVDCKHNENLYSFAGAHGHWIEDSSGVEVLKSKEFSYQDREQAGIHEDLFSWCKARDFGSPRWNFLKLLLDQKVDSMDQHKAEAFYNDCEQIVAYLKELKSVTVVGEKTLSASYSFAPLHLMNLKELKVYDFPERYFSLHIPHITSLGKLVLNRVELKSIQKIVDSGLLISELDVSSNPLENINDIDFMLDLTSVDLSDTKVINFKPLKLLSNLSKVNLSFTAFSDLSILKDKGLKELILGGNPIHDINLNGYEALESLTISSMFPGTISFLKDTAKLKVLNLPGLGIRDLDILTLFPLTDLEELNLTGNPIRSFAPLKGMAKLQKLRLFGTPIARGKIPRTEENCPTTGPEVLKKFCTIR